jgi:hypothetical protein
MTGLRLLFRVTLRRHNLAAELYHLGRPQKIPLVASPGEAKRFVKAATAISFASGAPTMENNISNCGTSIAYPPSIPSAWRSR